MRKLARLPLRLRGSQGLLGVACLATGVGVLAGWPWALIVVGVSLLLAAGTGA